MDLHLYNSLTKQKEKFVPIDEKEVTLYTCGPTVYGYAHIGNMSAYLMADVLIRVLELLGYDVKQVKNITDVGHLTSDGDEGEDKLDKEAKKQKKTPAEIADFYAQIYIEDEKSLRMREPFARPKATEYVQKMLKMVEGLVEKGFAYETSDGVYMDISKIPNYGELSGNKIEDLDAGARVAVNQEKKHPADFALWKKADANHIMQWDSPWGRSFPGWHLECSAMAWEYFEDTYDIKTGGEDNIFPHHECEIAQTYALFDKKLANYFLHKRHIRLNNEKMAKSKGNIANVRDLVEKRFTPESIRFALISSHYRNRLNFEEKLLEDSQKFIDKGNRLIQELYKIENSKLKIENSFSINNYQERFLESLCDDLNVSDAIVVVHESFKDINNSLEGFSEEGKENALSLIHYYNSVLDVFDFEEIEYSIAPEIQKLLNERTVAKEAKDYAKSDAIRDEIQNLGYKILDGKDGATVEKV